MPRTHHNVEVELLPAPRTGVVLSGGLDMADAEAVQRLLGELAEAAAPAAVVVDLRGLEFIDSTASGRCSALETTPSGPAAGSRSARPTAP